MEYYDENLIEILEKAAVIDGKDGMIAVEAAMRNKTYVATELISSGRVTEEDILKALAEWYGMDWVEIDPGVMQMEAFELVPEEWPRRLRFLPFQLKEDTLLIILTNPLDMDVVDKLRASLGINVESVVANRDQFQWAMEHFYPYKPQPGDYVIFPPRCPGTDFVLKYWTLEQIADWYKESFPSRGTY